MLLPHLLSVAKRRYEFNLFLPVAFLTVRLAQLFARKDVFEHPVCLL